MKLSKFTTTSITSALILLNGVGLAVPQDASAVGLLEQEVVVQIESALGAPENQDQATVDALTQIEFEIRSLGVTTFSTTASDSADIALLKQQRRDLITKLRSQLNTLEAQDRVGFLKDIRDRRKQVVEELKRVRRENLAELEARREEFRTRISADIESKKLELQQLHQQRLDEIENAREKFRIQVEARQREVEENMLSAEEKLQKRVESTIEKRDLTPQEQRVKIYEERKRREKIQGVLDEQPQSVFDKLHYQLEKRGLL